MSVYHDLCKEIDILETRIRDLEAEYKILYRECFKSTIPLDRLLERMRKICDQVEIYVTILEAKEKARAEIEKHLSEFERLDGKVAYLRDVEGMTLPEIAAHLGYSYSWIKKISMRTRRNRKKEPRRNHAIENL